MTQHNIIIFTDLDGCLLDHNNYSFTSAKPLLEKLKQYDIPLIINSSKTQLELEIIQKKIGIDTPFIIENGAAVIFNSTENTGHFNIDKNLLEQFENKKLKKFALLREELLSIANALKEHHKFKYIGFNDMTLSQISELTQLSRDDAFAASQRTFSEPIIWQDSQSSLDKFKHLLAEHKIKLQEGGRFIHLSGQYSKGEAMQWLLKYWPYYHAENHIVIALGDSMNDVSMLNNSDYALVIKNNAKKLQVQGKTQTLYSSLPGTSGWVETLTPLIEQFTTLTR